MNYQFLADNDLSLARVWAWAKKLVIDLNARDVSLQQAVVPVAGSVGWDTAFSPPVGWLVQDGSSYPVASYPALFNVIGYTYGGAGANFNVNNVANTIVKY